MDTAQEKKARYEGSCHCGAIRFEVELDLSKGASRCNCSVCTKIAPTTHVVKPAAFTLRTNEEGSGVYEWGGKSAKRFFCTRCGVHCYGRGYLDVLGGDYVSVNLNCLDDFDPGQVQVVYFDGRHNNWQAGPRPTPWPIEPAQARAW